MYDDRKQRLMNLGVETLADTLLDMAGRMIQVDDKISRLIGSEQEKIERYKKKIAAIRGNTQYIEYEETYSFANHLTEMLNDLQSGVTEPGTGLELVAEFFETDEAVFEMCDDSYGTIGEIYLRTAKDLFFHYAASCQDKEHVANIFLRLTITDNYGVRSSLMKNIPDFFDESVLIIILNKLNTLRASETKEKSKNSYTRMIESIESQQQEAQLFADALQGKEVVLPTHRMLEVARVLLERDDIESAHAWIKRIPASDSYPEYKTEKILKEIYTRQGDRKSLFTLHYKNFELHRSLDGLQDVLSVIGQDKRDDFLATELITIFHNPSFIDSDAQFLAEVNMINELEAYVLEKADTVDGRDYYTLPEIAEFLGEHACYLASSLLYRSLLDSMMERAYAKSYHHGVDYLRAMDAFAPLIKDWKTFPTHTAYKANLIQANKRKSSFWSQYQKNRA